MDDGPINTRKAQSGWHRSCLNDGTAHAFAAIMHQALARLTGFVSMSRGILAKVRNAVKIEIPVGYQDETGFHYGVKPAEKGIQCPPFW